MSKFFFIFFIPINLFSQSNVDPKIYNWFDDIIGHESLGLLDGKQYVDIFSGKIIDDSHVFFSSKKVFNGSVTYSGNTFYNVDLKYDSFNDELLYQANNKLGVIQLIKEKIAQFKINNSLFINLKKNFLDGIPINGFYEILYDGTIKIYKKNYKSSKDVFVDRRIKYKFISKSSYLVYKDEFNYANTKSELIAVFPKSEDYIKNYYRSNKNLRKMKYSVFMENLLLELTLLNKN